MIAIEQLAILWFVVKIVLWVLGNYENFSLKYFHNEIIPDENFPDYGMLRYRSFNY